MLPVLLSRKLGCAPPCALEGRAAPHVGPTPGLTYEIYVRSFQDSDGDGLGDLEGVRGRLDYLAGLGVETIWLMPLFQSFGPAGYHVTDFDTMTAAYGDPDDLAALVADAHARGMRVLLDLPLNHVHRSHPWFAAANADEQSPYRGWFRFDATREGPRWFPSEAGGDYYAYFGADMPDLDWTRDEVHDTLLAGFDRWLDLGADGYRLDAVLMLEEDGDVVEGADGSHELLATLYAELRESHPDAVFLAEASAWEVADSVSWLGSEDAPESDAVLDFPRRDALLAAADLGDASGLIDVIEAQIALGGGGGMAGFLGSHDVDRLPDVVESAEARRALRVAQLLSPGSPVIYYGEELDMPDASTGTGQDDAQRAPMAWDRSSEAGFTTVDAWFPADPSYAAGVNVDDEDADPASMLNLVRWLGCLRAAHDLDADLGWEVAEASPAVLAFSRASGALDVRINLSGASVDGLDPWAFEVQGGGTCGDAP